MQASDLAASAEDRSRFFWWLAEWFLNPPSRDMLASLTVTEETAAPADAMDGAWQAMAKAAPDPESADLEELGVEFTRLLSGVQEGMGPPPPFESVWREDRLIGESTVAVIEAYAQAGFADIAPEAGPQDHLAVELRFLSLLALREMEAWRGGDAAGAENRLAQQRAFLDRHLTAWAPRWADALMRQARLPLFQALAALLKAGLEESARVLDETTRALQDTARATA